MEVKHRIEMIVTHEDIHSLEEIISLLISGSTDITGELQKGLLDVDIIATYEVD